MSDADGEKLPSVEELKAKIASQTGSLITGQAIRAELEFARRFDRQAIEGQERYEHLRGLRGHYKHKGLWSYFIAAMMAAMIGFQCYLLKQVGLGAWDFSNYTWLLPALLVQNLAQVIALAVVVVKSLFKDMN